MRFIFRVNNEDVRLMLWDTAGQEEFDAITKAYYRGKTLNLCEKFWKGNKISTYPKLTYVHFVFTWKTLNLSYR